MKRVLCLAVVVALGVFLVSAGCSQGDKCGKAVDKAFSMAGEMMKTLSATAGDNPEAKKEIETKMKEALAELDKKKPEVVKACQEELKTNKDLEKVLDCVIEAKGMEEMQKCDSLGKAEFMNKLD